MATSHVASLGKNTDFVLVKQALQVRQLPTFDPAFAHLLRLPPRSGPSESVTYIYGGVPPVRIPIVATDGTHLGEHGDLDASNLTLFTKIRALDQDTGKTVCSWTLQTFTFSSEWRTYDAKEGFHLALLNAAQAPLLDFRISEHDVDISCGDKGTRRFATSSFSPDLYDIDVGAWIYLPGGVTFHHC